MFYSCLSGGSTHHKNPTPPLHYICIAQPSNAGSFSHQNRHASGSRLCFSKHALMYCLKSWRASTEALCKKIRNSHAVHYSAQFNVHIFIPIFNGLLTESIYARYVVKQFRYWLTLSFWGLLTARTFPLKIHHPHPSAGSACGGIVIWRMLTLQVFPL